MRGLIRCLVAVFGLALSGVGASAQATDQSYASLTADRIVYTTGYRVLRASGHVVITIGDSRMEATQLTYDEKNDKITAEGPIRLTNGTEVTIVASFAQLSGDMKNGILKSARMVLNQQLQLSASEISRTDGRYNQLVQAAASTCSVSLAHPTPLWQIRARRIIHDEERKLLFFERAQLRFGNVPVAYIPRLRVPGPTVRRANGFLVPEFSGSASLGYGIGAPYFITLGDYADVTLKPFVYSSGASTLGFTFRKRFSNGQLNLNGALSNDTTATNTLRAYLFADGSMRFRNGFNGDMQLQFTSDNSYLSDHGFSRTKRLESFVRLNKVTRQAFFQSQITGFRSLNTALANDEIPFFLGEVRLRKRVAPAGLGGQGGFDLSVNSYQRASGADIVGRDTLRLSSSADWSKSWFATNGLVTSATAEIHADYYNAAQDSTFPSPITRFAPIAALDFRLPMAKTTTRATSVIEPRVQLVWSPATSTTVPDEDSTQVEFETSSLFALNHFAGTDQIERGLRANIGFGFSRRSDKGWHFEAALGQVLRLTDPGQFSVASGLSGLASSYVLAGRMTLPDRFQIVQRSVYGPASGLAKNETRLAFKGKRFDATSSYLWLASGAAGNATDRSEWLVDAGYDLGNNWRTGANWRMDLTTNTASDAGVALTYSNECIKVDLSLSRQFAASSNVGGSTNLGLQVSLAGFGTRSASETAGATCNGFW